jgi:7-keto-8-aminopelargonate synthetase-like enzyme
LVAGPAQILDQLRQTPFFAGASPAPPAGMATLGVGLREGLYEQQHRRLLANVNYFHQQTSHLQLLKAHTAYPVFYFTNPELAAYLRENGIFFTDFEYAAEGGTSSPKRIVVSAAHQRRHLNRLVTVLEGFK